MNPLLCSVGLGSRSAVARWLTVVGLLGGVASAQARAVPAQPVPIPLRLVPAGAHDAEVQVREDCVEVRTHGTDPYVLCAAIETGFDPATYRVLSFEYSSSRGLDSVEVFYGPPIRAGVQATGDALPGTGPGEFSPCAIDLIAAGRGWAGHRRVRLDLGSVPGIVVRIRNLVLRAPTPAERRHLEQAAARAARDAARETWLAGYLGREHPARIDVVEVGSSSITIQGSGAGFGDRVGAFGPEVNLADGAVAVDSWQLGFPGDGTFRARIPRRGAGGRDRARSRFAVVRGASLRSAAVYPTRFPDEDPAARRPRPRSIKGLGGISWRPGKMMADLTDLGVHHITINLSLPSILRVKPTRGSQPFRFEGTTYHIHPSALGLADQVVGFAARNGMIVSGILLIPRRIPEPEQRRAFVHPDATAPGIYSMANLTTAAGARTFAAAMSFLAQRYGAGSDLRVHNWIVHNEVDAGWVWTNAGPKPLRTYVELYHRVMRTAYACLRIADPQARVFASLTHHFAATPRPRFYEGREVLETLARLTRVEGEFEWGVAYHPYPQDLREPRSWRDDAAWFAFDTPAITFRNIEVLDAFLRQKRFLYRGKTVRGVLLSEQGVDSGDGSEESLRRQAAGLAYAWLKVREVPSVEAFHYHRWVDHERESGLRLGLWSAVPGSISQPGEKKPAWEVYRRLGTDAEADACAPFLPMFGVARIEELKFVGSIPDRRSGR